MGNIKTDIVKGEVRLNANPAQKELNQLAKSTTELTKKNERLRQEKTRLTLLRNKEPGALRRINREITKNNSLVKRNKFRMEELQKTIGLTSLSKTQLTKKSRSLQRQLDATSKSANPSEFKRLTKELQAVDKQLNKVRRGATVTQRLWSSTKKFSAGILGAFSLATVVSGIADFSKQIFSLYVKMEGDARRANIVFGDSLSYVEKQAVKLSKKMGVTKNEFIAAASATADLLIPLDFTREQSAKMSVQLQSLTGALDEWTAGQIGASEISEILTKAMLGENEQLKRLGIAIRKDSEEFQTLVKQKLATTNATKAQAEAMATLELIQKKSADAQTAYNQEINTLLRTLKQAKLWWRNLKEGVVEFFNVPQSKKLSEQRAALNRNVESLILFNDNQKRRGEYIKKIQSYYPSFFNNMDTEKLKIEQIRDRLKEVNQQFLMRIKLAATSEQLQEQEEKAVKAQSEVYETMEKMPQNMRKAIAEYEKGAMSLSELRSVNLTSDNANGVGIGRSSQSVAAEADLLKRLMDKYIDLQEVIRKANKEQEKLANRKSSLENILGGNSITVSTPEVENINEKVKATRENIKSLKQDLADLRSGKKKSTNLKGDITKTETAIKEQESLLSTYTGKKTTVVPNAEKTASQISQWKEKAKELLTQAQQEIAAVKIAAMEKGYTKEEEKEKLRWEKELADLEARKIQKTEKQKELLPEQLAANAEIDKLIEAQKKAHWKKLADLETKCEEEHKLKKTEENLLRIEEEMLKAEEEEVAFEEKLALTQERYDLEFAAAEGNRQKELEAKRKFNSAVDKLQEEQHRKEVARQQATENLAKGLFANMKAMAKKGSALSKALYLFEQAMAIRQVIVNTQIANAKAVAASPLTSGMPWVGINTTLGAASVGLILAQTAAEFKGKEEGGYLNVRREQDGKPFRAKYKPNHRGYTSGPTVITGENGMEFVANAKAAQNPTVRPFLDIIDKAQRQGTIETLDLAAIRAERHRGFVDGGYLSAPAASAFDDDGNSNVIENEKQDKLMELIVKLASRPIEFSLLEFDKTRQLQQEIDESVNR